MAQIVGRELPNLKITLGNDGKYSEDSVEEGELSGNEAPSENVPESDKGKEDEIKVDVIRKWTSPLQRTKVYENKGGAFVTGLDLSSEVVLKKLEERATRFGLEERPKSQITQVEIADLYKSLEIDTENTKFPSSKVKNIRLDSIHMRGVDDMSTDDIFDYFKEYGPSSVEWINDISCNVVWLDDVSPARALLGLSRVLVVRRKSQALPSGSDQTESMQQEKEHTEVSVKNKGADVEEVILMSGESSDDEEEEGECESKHKQERHSKSGAVVAMDVDIVPENLEKNENADIEESAVDVPVPPGYWRLGIPHNKSKTILLRFSTKDDKKLRGAEKRSHYYQKYGNPNYGGLRGLISQSRKRKIQATRHRQVVEHVSELSGTEKQTTSREPEKSHRSSEEESQSGKQNHRGTKRMRMRMYADDEEEKMEKRSAEKRQRKSSSSRQGKRSVHDRLGKSEFVSKPFDWDEAIASKEEENNNERAPSYLPADPKEKTSRFNVWTRLAESMAEESETNESNMYETSYKQNHATDLRKKLHSSSSHRRYNPQVERRGGGDLRSKLEKMRKNDATKHRSPLLIKIDNESDSDI